MTRVKICGLTRLEDVSLACELGAGALGFILERSSPRYIGDRPDFLKAAAQVAGPYAVPVAVYGKDPSLTCPFPAAQYIPGGTPPEARIHIHVLRLGDPEPSVQHVADATLIDAYHPGGFGGTGMAVDWDAAAEIVRRSSRPVVLAGGLTPHNVEEAIERVRPYAVDVSSGIESSPGVKDHVKMEAFFLAVSRAQKKVRGR